MEIKGVIKTVLPQTGGTTKKGGHWAAQQYILETEDDNHVQILLEVFGQDSIDSFSLKEGETVTVDFKPEVNEYKGKYYGKNRIINVSR